MSVLPPKADIEGCLSDVRYRPLEAADAVARSAVAGKLIVPIAEQPDLWAETVKLRDQGEYRFCFKLCVHVLKIGRLGGAKAWPRTRARPFSDVDLQCGRVILLHRLGGDSVREMLCHD
jgi:hypothetical protein